MKKFINHTFSIFTLVFICSCQSKPGIHTSLLSKSSLNVSTDSTSNQSTKEDEKMNFELFIQRINKDCVFQKEHVEFPLKTISLMDFEKNIYNTAYITKNEYECMQFTAPKSNIIEEQVQLRSIHVSDDEKIILLGVEDTGVHIQYFFRRKENQWFLVKVLDEST